MKYLNIHIYILYALILKYEMETWVEIIKHIQEVLTLLLTCPQMGAQIDSWIYNEAAKTDALRGSSVENLTPQHGFDQFRFYFSWNTFAPFKASFGQHFSLIIFKLYKSKCCFQKVIFQGLRRIYFLIIKYFDHYRLKKKIFKEQNKK